jgi:hypothetical protein
MRFPSTLCIMTATIALSSGLAGVALAQDDNTESTCNWEAEDWSVPINFTVGKLLKIDKQPIS